MTMNRLPGGFVDDAIPVAARLDVLVGGVVEVVPVVVKEANWVLLEPSPPSMELEATDGETDVDARVNALLEGVDSALATELETAGLVDAEASELLDRPGEMVDTELLEGVSEILEGDAVVLEGRGLELNIEGCDVVTPVEKLDADGDEDALGDDIISETGVKAEESGRIDGA